MKAMLVIESLYPKESNILQTLSIFRPDDSDYESESEVSEFIDWIDFDVSWFFLPSLVSFSDELQMNA